MTMKTQYTETCTTRLRPHLEDNGQPSVHILETERLESNDLTFYLKKLEKEKQIKSKAGKRKKIMEVTAEIKKYKTNYTREKKKSNKVVTLKREN